MNTKQHNADDKRDTSDVEPRLAEPKVLTFSQAISFDGFLFVKNDSDSGIAA